MHETLPFWSFVLPALVTIVLIIFFLTGHPLWALLEASTGKDLKPGERMLWVLGIVMSGPVASILWGLFRARSKALRIVTVVSIVAGVLSAPLVYRALGEEGPIRAELLRRLQLEASQELKWL